MNGLFQSAAWLFRPVRFLERARRAFGPTFTMRLAGLPPFVVLSRPSDIKEVFTGDPDVFHAGSANTVLKPILGRSSLLLLDGERHMKERRLMMPSFHGERMHSYGTIMNDATDRSIDRWPLGTPFAIHRETHRITLDVIVRTVFGITEGAEKGSLRDALARMLSFGDQPALLLLIGADGELRWRDLHERLGRLSPWSRFKRTIAEVDGELGSEITARRPRASECDDVLSMLLLAKDEDGASLSDEELIAENRRRSSSQVTRRRRPHSPGRSSSCSKTPTCSLVSAPSSTRAKTTISTRS